MVLAPKRVTRADSAGPGILPLSEPLGSGGFGMGESALLLVFPAYSPRVWPSESVAIVGSGNPSLRLGHFGNSYSSRLIPGGCCFRVGLRLGGRCLHPAEAEPLYDPVFDPM